MNIPSELTQKKQWCNWNNVDGQKFPQTPYGRTFRSNDPATFATFDEAKAASDQIAFVIQGGDPYTGIDLDNCLDENGDLRDWAVPIVMRLDSLGFGEVSPSGQGIKFIVRGKKTEGARCVHKFGDDKQQIEVYDFNRFWTITGNTYAGNNKLGEGQHAVEWICDEYLTTRKAEPPKVVEWEPIKHEADKLQRASAYLATIEPAIAGSGGHNTTFRAACKMVIGFDLSADEAFHLLWTEYNPRCSPEWTEKELRHKVESACEAPGERGELLRDTSVHDSPHASKPEAKTALNPQPEYKAFPSTLLPSPLSELVVEGANAIGCDESFIALPLLSCVGAAVGNTARLVVKKGFAVPPTIWSMIVGESGTAKSPAFKVAKAALQHHQKNLLEQYDAEMNAYELEREQHEAAKKEFRRSKGVGDPPSQPDHPKPKRCMVSDTTVEALAPMLTNNPRGVLLQRDELNSWFGSFNQYKGSKGADEGDWLSMFDGGSITVDRKGEGQRPTFVESALVSITGGIQPAILAKSMSREHRDSGLASRFLFASPPRRPQRWTDDEISETTVMMIDRLFIKLFEIQFADGESAPNYIGMSPGAKELFVEFFNAHHQELNDLTGDSAAAWSKLLGYVPRIALLFHIVEQVHEGQDILAPVSASTMSRAIELIDWFKHETARVYAVIDETDEQRELRTLAGWIDRKHGGQCTPREIVQGMKHVPNVDAAELLANKLVVAGLASWIVTEPVPQGGRPKRQVKTQSGSTVYETA